MRKIVSIFAGSHAPIQSDDYQNAYLLGQELASNGFGIAVGGYQGLMEAIGKGVNSQQGYVAYVITDVLAQNGGEIPEWASEVVSLPSIYEHMRCIVQSYDGVIVLSGGIGTFGELGLL